MDYVDKMVAKKKGCNFIWNLNKWVDTNAFDLVARQILVILSRGDELNVKMIFSCFRMAGWCWRQDLGTPHSQLCGPVQMCLKYSKLGLV